MSTNVASVVSHFPDSENGFTTTLASTIASGATTVPLNSVAGYTNGQPAVFIVDPSDPTKKQTFTGIIDTSGVQVTSVVWTAGTNQTHTAGATVVDYATATHIAMISKGLQVEHKQTGAHSAITADSVTVATGKITTSAVGKLEDRGIALDTYRSGMLFDFVISGGVWTADSAGVNRNGSMTAIAVMINGQLLNSTNSSGLGAIAAHTFTASKDTYIDILNTAGVGTVVYTEANNNAASPALAANSLRIGIVVTAAGSIAAAASINQGQEDRVLPIASSIPYAVTDSLGNLICPRDPNRKIIGQRQIIADYTGGAASTAENDVTGLSIPVIVPAGRKIVISGLANVYNNTAAANMEYRIKEGATQLSSTNINVVNSSVVQFCRFETPAITPTAGSHTYKLSQISAVTAGPNVSASSTKPAFLKVELV